MRGREPWENQPPTAPEPRKGRQNRGGFRRRNLLFRPAGAPANQRAFWTQGWRPGLRSYAHFALFTGGAQEIANQVVDFAVGRGDFALQAEIAD